MLDVACGTGLVALAAARAVGPRGSVIGVDLSDRMLNEARWRGRAQRLANTTFARMDAECLALPDASVDIALCALGIMYLPHPERALAEMHRVLRPGGRVVLAVWGERERCAWAPVFPIVDAEVSSDVPAVLSSGHARAAMRRAGFASIAQQRIDAPLAYADADADGACNAAFAAGPVALAWSRFDDRVRLRVRERYLAAIEPWRTERRYRVRGEFVVVAASRALRTASARDHTADA